jgi:hypothetical protein
MTQSSQLAARPLPISPLSLDTLTRDYYGSWDAYILAQLAPLADNECYQPKIYRAPSLSSEVVTANKYTSFGLKITPGAIVYGFYLPPSSQSSNLPGEFSGPRVPGNLRAEKSRDVLQLQSRGFGVRKCGGRRLPLVPDWAEGV